MNNIFFIISILLLISCPANSKDLKHFNPDVLGKSMYEEINFFLHSNKNVITPYSISLDINQEKKIYYAATIKYLTNLSIEDAKKSINKIYKKYELKDYEDVGDFGIWRNNKNGFSIQLSEVEVEPGEKGIQILFMSFKHK